MPIPLIRRHRVGQPPPSTKEFDDLKKKIEGLSDSNTAKIRSSNSLAIDNPEVIEVLPETEMHSSLFISYGGNDEEYATAINTYLKYCGVRTWFFPDDALPGEKLHRVMSSGIANYDRTLLICSESALERTGVLNEVERVLEKEAKEGGGDILIPVSIDDYIFSEWAPERSDLADQIRSRVITSIPCSDIKSVEFKSAITKVIKALKK